MFFELGGTDRFSAHFSIYQSWLLTGHKLYLVYLIEYRYKPCIVSYTKVTFCPHSAKQIGLAILRSETIVCSPESKITKPANRRLGDFYGLTGFGRPLLLIIDEIGYLSFPKDSAYLFPLPVS